ncbi:MAG: DNA polymerase III subunit delta [Burkholderiales bacterium]
MKIESEQLKQHLSRGLKSLYTIHGDEPLLALEAADLLRAAARQAGYCEREIFSAEPGCDWQHLGMSSRSLSLFASKKIIEVRIPSGKPGIEGAQAIENFCSATGADLLGLVMLPKLDRQTQNSKWFTALQNHGETVQANSVELARLPQWIAGRLALQQQSAEGETLQFIAGLVEGNLLAAHQEVQKLGLLYPAGKLSFEQVQTAVLEVARYDVFKLSAAMLAADAVRFNRILEGLRGEGTAPPLILWALAEDTRALLRIVMGLERGQALPQLLREAKVWGARQDGMQRAAKRLSKKMLANTLLHAAKLDRMIKGLARGNIWDEFLAYGLRFCSEPAGVSML